MRAFIVLNSLSMQSHEFNALAHALAPLPYTAYDLTWTLPVGSDCARALRFLEQLRNRLTLYSPASQSLHFDYQLHAELEVGLIGVQWQQSDGIYLPESAIDATPSYIISGELVEREGLQVALWHHPRKPPVVYPLASALQRMTAQGSDYFFPILHEKSVSILPQSHHAVARIYRLNLAEIDSGFIDLVQLRAQLNASLQALL
jgi:hypothetical protein